MQIVLVGFHSSKFMLCVLAEHSNALEGIEDLLVLFLTQRASRLILEGDDKWM